MEESEDRPDGGSQVFGNASLDQTGYPERTVSPVLAAVSALSLAPDGAASSAEPGADGTAASARTSKKKGNKKGNKKTSGDGSEPKKRTKKGSSTTAQPTEDVDFGSAPPQTQDFEPTQGTDVYVQDPDSGYYNTKGPFESADAPQTDPYSSSDPGGRQWEQPEQTEAFSDQNPVPRRGQPADWSADLDTTGQTGTSKRSSRDHRSTGGTARVPLGQHRKHHHRSGNSDRHRSSGTHKARSGDRTGHSASHQSRNGKESSRQDARTSNRHTSHKSRSQRHTSGQTSGSGSGRRPQRSGITRVPDPGHDENVGSCTSFLCGKPDPGGRGRIS